MLTLDDLRFLRTVAESRSLGAAARALDVTPPAVSQRLAAIERRLNVRLVDRGRTGLQLTNEGELIARGGRQILDQMDELATAVAARRDELTGRLRIWAPPGFGRAYVAPLVSAFHARHPQIVVELTLADRLPENSTEFDLAVYIGELRHSAFVVTKIAPNRRVLCASPDYLDQYGVPGTPEALALHRCICLRENEDDASLWRFVRAKQTLSVRIKPVLASNDGDVIKQWALAGAGIIIRSEWHIAAEIRTGALVPLLPSYTLPSANVVALFGASRTPSARVKKFVDFLRGSLNPPPWRKRA